MNEYFYHFYHMLRERVEAIIANTPYGLGIPVVVIVILLTIGFAAYIMYVLFRVTTAVVHTISTFKTMNVRFLSATATFFTYLFYYTIFLLIVWRTSNNADNVVHDQDWYLQAFVLSNIDIIFMSIAMSFWIARSLSATAMGAVGSFVFFGTQIGAFVYLITSGSPYAFVVCTIISIIISVIFYRRFIGGGSLLDTIGHTLLLSILGAQLLYVLSSTFAEYQADASSNIVLYIITYSVRLRAIFSLLLLSFVLLVTIYKTVHKFTLKYDTYTARKSSNKIFALAASLCNIFLNLAINVAQFFKTVFVELSNFVWGMFKERIAWLKTIIYSTASILCIFLIGWDLQFARSLLTRLNSSPSIIIEADASVIYANMYFAVAFVIAISSVFGITRIWYRATDETILEIESRIMSGIWIISIFAVLSSLTFIPINFYLHYPDYRFSIPGIYTALPFILALVAWIVQKRRD